jgi:hypothetical protein
VDGVGTKDLKGSRSTVPTGDKKVFLEKKLGKEA